MSAAVVIAVGMALAFAFTNGLHDAANAIATLVATRAARPGPAVMLAALGNLIGPLILGKAVADTIAGIVTVPDDEVVFVLGAALTGAVAWNAITWWRALPSSSGHALLGGLVGAALAEGGTGAVNWGGFDGIKPVGVLGVMGVLALAPVFGFLAGLVVNRSARRVARRATSRVRGPGARRAVDDVGWSRLDPWCERCTEVDRDRGRVARRGRRNRASLVAGVGRACVRCRTHRGHHARRLADRPDDRPTNRSAATARRPVEPDRVHCSALRSVRSSARR